MLSSYRLNQLRRLATSHPQYFLHNYRRELANAGYEEIDEPASSGPVTEAPKAHGKTVLSAPSLLKAKNDKFRQAYGGSTEQTDAAKGGIG